MRLFFCSISFLFLLHAGAQQPDIKFENISKGLPNTNITCFFQDSKGFIWVGTTDGLCRYDGYQFRVFKNIPGDSSSLINNIISHISETKDGKIWLGTYNNCCYFDPVTEKFTYVIYGPNTYINHIHQSDDGLLWMTTNNKLLQYNPAQKKNPWKVVYNSNHVLWFINPGKSDIFWISTWNGFLKFNSKDFSSRHFLLPVAKKAIRPTQIVGHTTFDKEGNLWLSTWENGLHMFNPDNETFKSFYYSPHPDSLKSNITTHLLATGDSIWVTALVGGLSIYNKRIGRFSTYQYNKENPFSIAGKSIGTLFQDRTGAIWVGSENGISKYYPQLNFFQSVALRKGKENTSPLSFWSLFTDKDGDMWASDFFGIYYINPSGKIEEYSMQVTGTADPPVYDIIQDAEDNIWLNGNDVLYKFKKRKGTAPVITSTEIIKTPGLTGRKICSYGDSTLFIISDHGIFRFNKHTRKFILHQADTLHNDIRELTLTHTGKWLAGIRNTGLHIFNPENGKFTGVPIQLKHNKSQPILIRRINTYNSRILISTDYDGLLLLDQNLQLIKQYTEADGLPSMRVYDTEPDNHGGCWFYTEGGLAYLSSSGRITQYGNKNGLYNQFQLHRLIADTSSKKLHLHETGYLHHFTMLPMKGDSLHRFPVYITRIHSGNGDIINQPHNRFSYRHNDFTIDFVALDYINTEKIQYAYLLEGSSDNWIETGNQHSVRIANVREGNYTFRVKARIEDGPWIEATDVFKFTIRPPFYRAWWFYLLCASAVAFIIYYLYQQKIKRIRSEEKIRNKIARDLHDDIGSTLSGINLFSKMALHKMNDSGQEAKAIIQKIGDRTENMMDAMSDIVWSINPKNDAIANMLVRMKEYAAEMLEAKDIDYWFTADESISDKKLDLSIRKEIFLVYKEAINNAAKHAHCTAVNIQLTVRQHQLVMNISDNGLGLAKGNGKTGNGLKNMQERALLLKGKLDITAAAGEGTSVQLTVPIT